MPTKTLNPAEARRLTNSIRAGLQNIDRLLRQFYKGQGWAPLGYDSFIAWWDANLQDIPIAKATRDWAIASMYREAPRYRRGGMHTHGAVKRIAKTHGVTDATVRKLAKTRPARRRTGTRENDLTGLTVMIPKGWYKDIREAARTEQTTMSEVVRESLTVGLEKVYGVKLRGVNL